MAPKKKTEEEAPPPEELLPAGYSIGCEIFWVQDSMQFGDGESSETVQCGHKGSLVAVPELAEFEKEDGSKGYIVESVEALFEGLSGPQCVPIKALSLEPPPLEILSALSTGLNLPLKGTLVTEIWAVQHDHNKQLEMLVEYLGLTDERQRQIVAEFHLFNLAHAKSICLSNVQGAVFIAIMGSILDMMKTPNATSDSKPDEMTHTASACFQEFERLIIQHATNNPPEQLAIFQTSEVKMLMEFASSTLFKHFLLYQYCINVDREVQSTYVDMQVQKPAPPPELGVAKLVTKRQALAAGERDLITGDGASGVGPDEEVDEEEQEIERIVQEKLRDTEQKLHAHLEDREKRLQDMVAAKPKAKGK